MTVTPEKLYEAARLIAGTAEYAEAKGMPGHAQQLADRADLVESWARDLTHYRRDGVEVTAEWTRYIESATAEFLAFAGYPQQEQERGRHAPEPEQRRRPMQRNERGR